MALSARARLALGALLILAVSACSTPGTDPSPGPADGVVVTLLVVEEEQYRIRLTDPADIDVARKLLAGDEAPAIPNGKVVYGDDGGVNTGYSWHIDPDDIDWADMTIELCDGRPSDVEDRAISGARYCPWHAKVIAVEG
jgi:hypothetical protein